MTVHETGGSSVSNFRLLMPVSLRRFDARSQRYRPRRLIVSWKTFFRG